MLSGLRVLWESRELEICVYGLTRERARDPLSTLLFQNYWKHRGTENTERNVMSREIS
jgi:hypothetical protein